MTRRLIGRKHPYAMGEIARAKCRCGKTGAFQWNCCAIDNRWVAVCRDCDIGMNEMVLAFFRVPDRARLMSRYRRRVK
jgi:hypothetical protein